MEGQLKNGTIFIVKNGNNYTEVIRYELMMDIVFVDDFEFRF